MESRITVDLKDGDSAILLTEMKHGTQRRIEEISRSYIIYPKAAFKVEQGKVIQAEIKGQEVEIDWSKFDESAIVDECILGQVLSWSFSEDTASNMGLENGFAPVTREILDDLPKRKYQILKSKIDEIFGQIPFPESGAGN